VPHAPSQPDAPAKEAPSGQAVAAPPQAEAGVAAEDETPGDLSAGLERSRGGFMSRLRGILKSGPDDEDWESVEELLISGDVGGALSGDIVESARARRDAPSAEAAVRTELASRLMPAEPHWRPRATVAGQPAVVLMVGVNGTG
jgi:signal recognition particle GTPase